MQYAMSTPENSGLLLRPKIRPNYVRSSAENSAELYIKAENSAVTFCSPVFVVRFGSRKFGSQSIYQSGKFRCDPIVYKIRQLKIEHP